MVFFIAFTIGGVHVYKGAGDGVRKSDFRTWQKSKQEREPSEQIASVFRIFGMASWM